MPKKGERRNRTQLQAHQQPAEVEVILRLQNEKEAAEKAKGAGRQKATLTASRARNQPH